MTHKILYSNKKYVIQVNMFMLIFLLCVNKVMAYIQQRKVVVSLGELAYTFLWICL